MTSHPALSERSEQIVSTTVVQVDADYCDACPSEAHVQAFVYAELKSGRSLSMCAHHGKQHVPALIAQGATVIDLSHLVHA